MQKMVTENGVKFIVECELEKFELLSTTGCRAHLTRTTCHPRLGAPPARGHITITSQILNIDFQKKQFETLNTVYRWR